MLTIAIQIVRMVINIYFICRLFGIDDFICKLFGIDDDIIDVQTPPGIIQHLLFLLLSHTLGKLKMQQLQLWEKSSKFEPIKILK